MQCGNCGKEISFVGNVCPYCHANKAGDQKRHLLAVVGGVGGALLGLWGFGVLGAVGGLFAGAIVGAVAGSTVKAKK